MSENTILLLKWRVPTGCWLFGKSLTFNLSDLDGWALAVYQGKVEGFQKGSPLGQLQPLDAFVCSGHTNAPSAILTETLIPGRKAFKFDSR